MSQRHLNFVDRLLAECDQALRTVVAGRPASSRANPAADIPQDDLDAPQRRESGRLMRVNHAGEVAAQALYQGQAFTTRNPALRTTLAQSAAEESDHLHWCQVRLRELDTPVSLLNPFWYAGSFAIGALAGLAGDRWNLGFLAETERQVETHLAGHLERLPEEDARSRRILIQMRDDETHHRHVAERAGGASLPKPVRMLMQYASRMMTFTAYRI